MSYKTETGYYIYSKIVRMANVPMISENINLMSLTITNDKNIVINQGHKENVIIIWDQDNKLLCLFILQNRYHCKNNYLI